MTVTVEIPEEFEEHYDMDHFEDSLKRIESDLKHLKYRGLSGRYELELTEMLGKAFNGSKRNED